MRGLAVLIMIQCHTFNCFVRMDLRDGGPYVLSQFVGGMAAPLFLFMAGITLAFQMKSLDRREPIPWRRWLGALRRGGYILGIAFAFRLTNWLGSVGHAQAQELTRVDILNCMGVGAMAISFLAMLSSKSRARSAAGVGLAIAALAPLVANLNWSGAPPLLHEYLAPGFGRGRFAFFPCASYVAFGLSLGTAIKRTAPERLERLIEWCVPIGFALVFTAQYFSNIPYSIYPKSDFWTDSPALILIRVGICLLLMAGAYVWTEYCASGGWSWMLTLGKTSLLVYWVHVAMVYGRWTDPIKRWLDIPQTAALTLALMALMLGLAEAKLRWAGRRAEHRRAAALATAAATAASR